MKIKMNLGDNRKCDTFICKECNKAFYDNVWRGQQDVCEKCKEKVKKDKGKENVSTGLYKD